MKPILVVARLTWTELIRDRFVALFGFVAVALLFLSLFLGSLTLDEQMRLLVHLGFSGFQLTLVGLSLFLGSWSLQKELDRQTCLLVLSRPVSRTHFLLGKFLGAFFLLILFWALCGIFHSLLLGLSLPLGQYAIVHSTLLVEAFLLLSLAFFFASFLKPLLALASTLTLWLAGHWRDDLLFFAKKSKNAFFMGAAEFATWVFPPLNKLEVRTLNFLNQGEPSLVLWPSINLICMGLLLLFASQWIWRRKDLV